MCIGCVWCRTVHFVFHVHRCCWICYKQTVRSLLPLQFSSFQLFYVKILFGISRVFSIPFNGRTYEQARRWTTVILLSFINKVNPVLSSLYREIERRQLNEPKKYEIFDDFRENRINRRRRGTL